jgi:hypothetical protein
MVSRVVSRRAARPDRAPLSWTSERADTLFVGERARKPAASMRDPRRASLASEAIKSARRCPGPSERADTLSSERESEEGSGFQTRSTLAMFAPPICRRSRRRRGRERVRSSDTIVSSDPMKTAAARRTSQRAERAIRYSELGERGNQPRVATLAGLRSGHFAAVRTQLDRPSVGSRRLCVKT